MNKLLLLAIFGVLLYLFLTRSRRSLHKREDVAQPAVETMIQCAYCGVHLPLGESFSNGDMHYCCEEHRRLGPG